MGDTVNLASRLEGLNKPYGTTILVSDGTHAAAADRIVMRAVDVVAVKGRTRGARVYEPLALAGDIAALERARLADAALEAYVARRFEDAGALYAEMQALVPSDEAAATMKSRTEAYARTPPPEGWDGVAIMTEK
jgi:adenylate cyclase